MSDCKSSHPMLMGKPMPLVGLGTWQSQAGEVERAVAVAIEAGYRHIDTARGYLNEREIGNAVDAAIKAGKVKREDLFITTKLTGGSARPHQVSKQTERSLKCLKTDYIDLLLIHFPIAFTDIKLENSPPDFLPSDSDGAMVTEDDYLDTYKEMEKLVDAGLVKAIGLSNFNTDQVKRVWNAARIKPSNLQVECHAWFPQYELADLCREKRITLSAYAPIGSPGTPTAFKGADDIPLKDPVVLKLAEKLNRTPAQILLRYLVQRDIVVLPKSVTKERIESNIKLFDFSLSDSEIEEIKSINRETRLLNFKFLKCARTVNHTHRPWDFE